MKNNTNKTKDHNWKKLSSKVEYINPFMQVRKDNVIRPDGKMKPFYVLERGGPFSIIIPHKDRDTTYLVRQYRYPASRYSWEFPMGHVSKKSPSQMAIIELREETGITAKKWEQIGHFFVANGHSSQDAYVFVAFDLKKGKPKPEEDEFLEVKEIKLKKIEQMIENNTIKDGPTITAFYFYNIWKNNNK